MNIIILIAMFERIIQHKLETELRKSLGELLMLICGRTDDRMDGRIKLKTGLAHKNTGLPI